MAIRKLTGSNRSENKAKKTTKKQLANPSIPIGKVGEKISDEKKAEAVKKAFSKKKIGNQINDSSELPPDYDKKKKKKSSIVRREYVDGAVKERATPTFPKTTDEVKERIDQIRIVIDSSSNDPSEYREQTVQSFVDRFSDQECWKYVNERALEGLVSGNNLDIQRVGLGMWNMRLNNLIRGMVSRSLKNGVDIKIGRVSTKSTKKKPTKKRPSKK